MTLGEVQKHQLYSVLTVPQRQFVTLRCEGKTPDEAAKLSWNCTTDASVRTCANRASRNVNIKFLVDKFYGTVAVPTREELAANCWMRLQDANNADAARLIQIAARLLGYEMKAAEAPAPPLAESDDDEEFNL